MFLLILKKLVARLLFPMPLALLVLAVGLCLSRRRGSERCRRIGWWMILAATGFLLFAGVAGSPLLRFYSSGYRPFSAEKFDPGEDREFLIAVAGSGFFPDESIPPACRFNDGMELRLREAGRVAALLSRRGIPYRVAVSVAEDSAPPGMRLEAARAALELYAVPSERVILIDGAMNSRAEVRAFRDLGGRVILVSEAFHLPRLMQFARKFGVEAFPAPAALRGRQGRVLVLVPLPSAESFADFERLVYELLGRLEAALF